jgi:hypothetical protein
VSSKIEHREALPQKSASILKLKTMGNRNTVPLVSFRKYKSELRDCWAVRWVLSVCGRLLAHVEAWSLTVALDFAFEQTLDQLRQAALLSISQGLGGLFDFGVEGDVGFFSHVIFIALGQKMMQYFSL